MGQVIKVLKKGSPYREGTARALWYQRLLAFDGQVVENFLDSVTRDPPSTPETGKLEGTLEPPEGWIAFFIRDGVLRLGDASIGGEVRARNPNWTRDELILALDLYLRDPKAAGNEKHPGVIELSQLLNALPIHPRATPGLTFRNPNGVGMKLSNFLRYDPAYNGAGLKRGSHLEEEVWNDFAKDPERLAQVAAAIRANADDVTADASAGDLGISDDEEAAEGRILTRVHQARERDGRLVARKKAKVMAEAGRLACEACGFDFGAVYGSLGTGFAECHHEIPISTLGPGDTTRIADLRILCANCHRMVHRGRPWLSIEELRTKLSERQGPTEGC